MMILCCPPEDLCKGVSCKVDQTDNGLVITLSSDDPKKVEKLKAAVKCCCDETEDCCK